MKLAIHPELPPLESVEEGSVRIAGTRIGLEHLVERFMEGQTPERIVEEMTSLNLADVYTVLGYYLRHRKEVDEYLIELSSAAHKIRAEIEHAGFGGLAFKEKLLKRRPMETVNDSSAGG